MVGACVTLGPVAPCTTALPPSATAHATTTTTGPLRPPIVLENKATPASCGCTHADTKMALNPTMRNSSTCPGGRLYPGIGRLIHGPSPRGYTQLLGMTGSFAPRRTLPATRAPWASVAVDCHGCPGPW